MNPSTTSSQRNNHLHFHFFTSFSPPKKRLYFLCKCHKNEGFFSTYRRNDIFRFFCAFSNSSLHCPRFPIKTQGFYINKYISVIFWLLCYSCSKSSTAKDKKTARFHLETGCLNQFLNHLKGRKRAMRVNQRKKPLTISSSASFSVRPSVISFMSCSPAIFPMAAS